MRRCDLRRNDVRRCSF
ncbi:hypothetical protein [Shewanella baltica]